jgi:predicted AlkP superfamily phosphohydrolase/phosphomutase
MSQPPQPTDKRVAIIGLDSTFLPLYKRFVDEGVLPTFARLLAEGTANEAMPCLPCYTPTNWATLATGALPGAHGAANWDDRRPGQDPAAAATSTFNATRVTAETIWEAAERAGLKCLVVAHPAAWPPRIKAGYVVAPLDRGLTSFVILPGEVYDLDLRAGPARVVVPGGESAAEVAQETLAPSAASKPAGEVRSLEDGAEFGAPVARRERLEPTAERLEAEGGGRAASRPLGLRLRATLDGDVVVLEDETEAPAAGAKPVAALEPGAWSDWLFGAFVGREGPVRASCRFKLLSLGGGRARLLRSEVYPCEGIAFPPGLAAEIIEHVGPYFEHPARRQIESEADLEAVIEEMRYQAQWHVRLARYLQERDRAGGARPWDLYQSHWHWPDSAIHAFLAQADPAAPAYVPERGAFALEVLRRTMQVADEMVAGFKELVGDDGYVFVVSDHGNSPNMYACDIQAHLAERGLVALSDEPTPRGRPRVDRRRSRAYMHGGLQVCVNLRGRDPGGTVEPADYERVQEEIIDALYEWKHPQTGKRAVALALKKRDAQLIGFFGETVGDVIFVYNNGFSWTQPRSGTIDVARGGANHGPQLPTAATAMSSNLAVLMAWGPGIRPGYERDRERLGLMRLLDVVPTVCHVLGIRPPAQATGAVLWDIFE